MAKHFQLGRDETAGTRDPETYSGFPHALDLLGFPVHIRTQSERDAPLIQAVLQLDREFAVKAPGYKQSAAGLLMQVLLHIVRNFGSSFKPPFATDRSLELSRLLPAFDC